MRSFFSAAVVLATACIQAVVAVAPTDEYRDADAGQSGYLPNHNLDPAIVDSTQFGQLWKVAFNKGEQVRKSALLL
jgi:iron transport multicopper oxidase